MNYAIIFKLLSAILLTLAIAFLVSMGVGYLYQIRSSEEEAMVGFGLSIAIALAIAAAFYLLGRHGEQKMFRKEALCVIGFGWIVASLIGALPYLLILPDCSLAEAVFESASGLTTTGASVFTNLERFPRSLLFWRCMSQWMGGLGIVVFFVAILSFLGAGAKILFSRESTAHSSELDTGRVQTGMMRILGLYLGLSVVCATAYHLCGMGWYDAVCHMFTTLATGGFSNYSNSIAAFQSPLIEWVFILFMMLSGTSFLVMLRLLRGKWKEVRGNTETGVYYTMVVFFTLLVTLLLLRYENIEKPLEALRTSAFQVVSLMTTSGFVTADFDAWVPATHAILLILMIIGGSSGSTAGGVKVVRMVIGIKICLVTIEKAFRSHVVRPIRINGRNLDQATQDNVITYMVLITLVGYISVVVVALFEPQLTLEGTYAAVISCLYNIGPGFAEVGPTHNYYFFHDYTKYFLTLLMIMGRLELFAILVLFAPSLWKRFS